MLNNIVVWTELTTAIIIHDSISRPLVTHSPRHRDSAQPHRPPPRTVWDQSQTSLKDVCHCENQKPDYGISHWARTDTPPNINLLSRRVTFSSRSNPIFKEMARPISITIELAAIFQPCGRTGHQVLLSGRSFQRLSQQHYRLAWRSQWEDKACAHDFPGNSGSDLILWEANNLWPLPVWTTLYESSSQ